MKAEKNAAKSRSNKPRAKKSTPNDNKPLDKANETSDISDQSIKSMENNAEADEENRKGVINNDDQINQNAPANSFELSNFLVCHGDKLTGMTNEQHIISTDVVTDQVRPKDSVSIHGPGASTSQTDVSSDSTKSSDQLSSEETVSIFVDSGHMAVARDVSRFSERISILQLVAEEALTKSRTETESLPGDYISLSPQVKKTTKHRDVPQDRGESLVHGENNQQRAEIGKNALAALAAEAARKRSKYIVSNETNETKQLDSSYIGRITTRTTDGTL